MPRRLCPAASATATTGASARSRTLARWRRGATPSSRCRSSATTASRCTPGGGGGGAPGGRPRRGGGRGRGAWAHAQGAAPPARPRARLLASPRPSTCPPPPPPPPPTLPRLHSPPSQRLPCPRGEQCPYAHNLFEVSAPPPAHRRPPPPALTAATTVGRARPKARRPARRPAPLTNPAAAALPPSTVLAAPRALPHRDVPVRPRLHAPGLLLRAQ
jgi:hypothetical protein